VGHLVLVFTVTGGKPDYLAGLFPVLLAAGSIDVDAWLGAAGPDGGRHSSAPRSP
jgi:hypothetical protein